MMIFYKYYNDKLDLHDEYADRLARFLERKKLPDGDIFDKILHIIKRHPHHAYAYARGVLKRRWVEVEDVIMVDHNLAYRYTETIIRGRWPEAEPIIMKDLHTACLYAAKVLKERWLDAESKIMKDPRTAYSYAMYVIGGRWLEAEDNIKYDEYWWNGYCKQFNIPT